MPLSELKSFRHLCTDRSLYLQKIDKIDLGGKIPVEIKEISIFSNGFVDKEKEELNRADNIFIRNIKLNCLASKDQRHLSINASNGYTLSEAVPELNFTAVPMIGSRAVVNEKSNFYVIFVLWLDQRIYPKI